MGAGAVDLPEGFTLDQSSGGLPPGFKLDTPQEKSYGQKFIDKFVAPQFEAGGSIASGMVSGPLAGISGLAGTVIPGPQGQGADWAHRVQNAMTYQPRTEGGKAITGAVAAPFELLAKGADAAGQFTTDVTGSPMAGTAVNTMIQGAPMAVGKVLPKAPVVSPSLARAAEIGLKVTPEEAGAGVVSKTAASLAGEPRLARKISNANEGRVNELIAKDFNLPKGTQLTRDTLEEIRSKNSGVYDEIRKSGEVTVDQKFRESLSDIVKNHEGAAKDFPRKGNPVMEVYERLMKNEDGSVKQSFDANSAVSEINNLRADGKTAFANRDTQLGKANMAAAKALEDILDRHMQATGKMDSVQGMRDARQLIAKTYEAERAMMSDGTINPQAYAKMLEKKVPLSGGARVVAESARDFPRSMQKPSGQATGPSFADTFAYFLGRGGDGMSLSSLPFLFARPAARSVIASDPYQSLFIQRGLQGALASDAMKTGVPLGAYAGVAGNQRGGQMETGDMEFSPPRRGNPPNRVGGGTR